MMSQTHNVTKGYITELDGLRAVSVIFVLLVHATYGRLSGGILGVDIFFVLSGYLITTLLMRENQRNESINLRKFYLRRAFRILPPLLTCTLLAVLVWHGDKANIIKTVPATLLFYANFIDPKILGNLAHTWSLSIEEQFYIVWPAMFILLAARASKTPAIFSILIILIALSVRFYMGYIGTDPNLVYSMTLARMDSLMFGCLLACIEAPLARRIQDKYDKLMGPMVWLCSALILGFLVFSTRTFMQTNPFAFSAFAGIVSCLIFCIRRVPANNLLRLAMIAPIMRYIGRRSYGLYLYHYPIFLAMESFRVEGNLTNYIGVTIIKILVSFAVTELSWQFIEKPMLKIKQMRFSAL